MPLGQLVTPRAGNVFGTELEFFDPARMLAAAEASISDPDTVFTRELTLALYVVKLLAEKGVERERRLRSVA